MLGTVSAEMGAMTRTTLVGGALVDDVPAGATAEITESSGLHYVTVANLADGAEATAEVTTEAPGDVTASAEVTSAALGAPLTPAFGDVTPTDGGFTVALPNYDGAYGWQVSATNGSASISTSKPKVIIDWANLMGKDSTVMVDDPLWVPKWSGATGGVR